jgi:hypothetical protein
MKKLSAFLFSISIIFSMVSCKSESNNKSATTDQITHSADSSLENLPVTAPSEKTAISDESNDSSQFSKVLSFKNISFVVNANGKGSRQKLIIRPSGLTRDNNPIILDADPVVGAEIGDLNTDEFPEILIFTQSAGSGSYGKVLAYSVNAGRSISQVTFLTASQNPQINNGYRGHDRFKVVNNQLVHTFPLFETDAVNTVRSGKNRIVTYKVKVGEASLIFEVDKVTKVAVQ